MSMFLSVVFFLFFNFSIFATPYFVTCRISGQLANNINQIATTLAYAWDNGLDPYFPELDQERWNVSYNRDHFFFRLNSSPLPGPIKNIYDEYANGNGWWDCCQIPFHPDQYLTGDFFCWKHFHHHRDRLLDIFAPSSQILNYIFSKYAWILANPNAVSLHVRTYNKQYHETTVRFLGLDYYKKAMDFFPPETLFVIFSDRINWCRRNFPPDRCVFIEGNNHIQDFFLMSMIKNHIISNSCYSWWAAYLCNHPEKTVVAPSNSGREIDEQIRDNIYLPDWNLISFELEETYPPDMNNYDLYSQSVDTQ